MKQVIPLLPDVVRNQARAVVSDSTPVPIDTTYITLNMKRVQWQSTAKDEPLVTAEVEVSQDEGKSWQVIGGFTSVAGEKYDRFGNLRDYSECLIRLPRALMGVPLIARANIRSSGNNRGAVEMIFTDGAVPHKPQTHNSVTYDADAEVVGINVTSLSISSFTVADNPNRALIAGVASWDDTLADTAVSGFTWNSSATGASSAGNNPEATSSTRTSIWSLVNPAVTTATATITMVALCEEVGFNVLSVYNVDQSTPTGTFAGDDGTSGNATVDVSSATDDLVYDVVYHYQTNADASATPGTGQTERANTTITVADGDFVKLYASTKPGASTTTMSWTLGGTGGREWNIGAVSIKEASAPPLISASSCASDPGFANVDTPADTNPFNSGDKASYTVQAGDALAPGTYYWRVRAKDPSGSDTFGAWSTPREFDVEASSGETLTAQAGSYSLTGQSANLLKGYRLSAEPGTFTVTGNDANLTTERRLTAEGGTYAITGQSADLTASRKLTAESGSYALNGQNANLVTKRKIVAEGGTYAITGNDMQFKKAYRLTAEGGTFTLTGNDAGLRTTRKVTVESGSYTVTGTDANLAKGRRLTAESGTYALTGNDANLIKVGSYVLSAQSGTFTVTGNDANLIATRKLTAESGEYTFTGNDANLTKSSSYVVTAESGSYTVSGQSANLLVHRRLSAEPGTFTLAGQSAGLRASRRLVASVGTFILTGTDANLLVHRRLTAEGGTYVIIGSPLITEVHRYLHAESGVYNLEGNDAILTYTPILMVQSKQAKIVLSTRNPSIILHTKQKPTKLFTKNNDIVC